MKVIILSGQANQAISQITAGEAVGALQLVNRPLVNFIMETLQQQLNIGCFQMLGDSDAQKIINNVEFHLDWGTSIQPFTDDCLCDSEEVLWVRDDVLYDLNFDKLLQKARQTPAQSTVFCMDSHPVIFYQKNNGWRQPSVSFSEKKTTHDFCYQLLEAYSWHRENIKPDSAYLIDTVERYYRCSMKLLKATFNSVTLDYHQQGLPLIKGEHVSMENASQKQHHAYVGNSVYVHANSQIHEQAILCSRCYIDRFVDISDSIVMPGVYIGCYLNIINSVVTQNAVIRVDTGNVLPIVDKKMIAEVL